MGLLSEFFAAAPDVAATIDPARWRDVAPGFDVLESGGVEPTVMLGALEEVLIGRRSTTRWTHP